MTDYQPGVCNIGEPEQRLRLITGILSMISAGLVLFLILRFGIPRISYIAIFILLLFGFEGLVQYEEKFCAGYAVLGYYNLSDTLGDAKKVQQEKERRRDLLKAFEIHVFSLSAAAIATLLLIRFVG
jgi:hypothetical protein